MPYWIELPEALGSDSCVPLDGRFSYSTAQQKGLEYCKSLRFVKPWLTCYVISQGSKPSNLHPCSAPIPLPEGWNNA